MADMNSDQSFQSPNSLMPSTPLQLSGFLTGDTIQVRGDTGNLKFSVQFSVQEKQTYGHENRSILNSLDANACFPENHSCANSSFSSYMTPNDIQEVEDHGNEVTHSCETRISGESHIVTRLRSGVISRPVTYFPRIPLSSSRSLIRRCGKESSRKKKCDMFERVLRRHSCPIRPCTSYAFFVMAAWGSAQSSSFGERSKQLGRMWCQLPRNEKKLYEKMAMKDNARYKRQCSQLMGKPLRALQKGSR
ncbi:hypothetical protein C1H46_015832 [Malus baccata]|uniref:HMG box domain-containing protein n=1 Tax=Malus baccata TaxID=106549 RepID=A0A540MIK7_MALBA|nr:hypothetical protein C1H46_015832 [Malus baccata]